MSRNRVSKNRNRRRKGPGTHSLYTVIVLQYISLCQSSDDEGVLGGMMKNKDRHARYARPFAFALAILCSFSFAFASLASSPIFFIIVKGPPPDALPAMSASILRVSEAVCF